MKGLFLGATTMTINVIANNLFDCDWNYWWVLWNGLIAEVIAFFVRIGAGEELCDTAEAVIDIASLIRGGG